MTFHSDSNLSFNFRETTFDQNHTNFKLETSASAKPGNSQDIATKTNEIVVAMARRKPGSG